METIKVLVVDDTIVYRKIVSDVFKEFPEVEVVGTATNGKIALSRIASLKPDLVTLDIEMPEMSGIEVLEHLQTMPDAPTVVMLSTLTSKGSEMTVKALELGAFDFIPKPDSGRMAENTLKVRETVGPILKAFQRQREIRTRLKGNRSVRRKTSPLKPSISPPRAPLTRKRTTFSEIVGIGISTGGPNALAKMMPLLSPRLNVPILVVQHMPPMFTRSLAKSLNGKCSLEVKEAINGESILPNTAYIAPGGKQMKITAGADGLSRIIKITDDPPENSCKPSVDYLFRSIAEHYVGRATGVIMTGMGSDGTKGLAQMKQNGSIIIAQDKASCTVYGMPKEPIESGLTDVIAPLDRLAAEITKTVVR
ncbi:MAG: chemotaxis response regulator protein-glutamate methylesterase [Desulfobacteraceae bacterium 4572_89]|nr:MAG: chemotaxis response regulator protein-glutamate methylesterase [Desulfobacteraceae bacterium 4572_89]